MSRPATVIVLSETEKAEFLRRVKRRRALRMLAFAPKSFLRVQRASLETLLLSDLVSARTWYRGGGCGFRNGDCLV
jgi:hypothetical protein